MPGLEDSAAVLVPMVEEALGAPLKMPAHWYYRLGALLGADDPVFVDADVVAGDDGTVTGTVVVFTATRVIELTGSGSPVDPAPDRGPANSATARTWARSDLTAVELAGQRNSDVAWHTLREDRWPIDAQLRLFYASGRQLVVPLGHGSRPPAHRTALGYLVTGLLTDLTPPTT